MAFDPEHATRLYYEDLLIAFPRVSFGGLWRDGDAWYVVRPHGATFDANGSLEPPREWTNANKQIGVHVKFVDAASANAKLLPERSTAEISLGVGLLRSLPQFWHDLAIELPTSFPTFELAEHFDVVEVFFERVIADDEWDLFARTAERLGVQVGVRRGVVPPHGSGLSRSATGGAIGAGGFRPARWGLTSARALRDLGYSGRVASLAESDQRFWRQYRRDLWSPDLPPAAEILGNRRSQQSSCLVSASPYAPMDLRIYLSLYEHIYLGGRGRMHSILIL